MNLKVAWSFLRRDLKIAASYRAAFAMQIVSIFLVVPLFYFLGGFIDGQNIEALKPYGGSYFGFLLIGVALLDYLTVSLSSFSQSLRESQLTGTLEVILMSPTSLIEVLLYSSLWSFVIISLRFVLYLAVGAAFALDLGQANVGAVLLILVMAILSFIPFGIFTASLVMLIKRGESFNALISGASLFFGGVFFPVAAMPEWLQQFSHLLPFTYALEGMRRAVQVGGSIFEFVPQLSALAAFTVVLLPLSFFSFSAAFRRTRVMGSLGQY